ncbi:MAG: hypothetical protein AUF65_02370 [Chloroflexi bacterium 13_1_20CM_50_12]|nr:MAG: hypothetical protein AUF65_02370 [Chloroflexi bacterium 13_1_20CM_50_12]
MSRGKLNRPQIEALAALYHCKVTDGFMGSIYVEHDGKREDIAMWYVSKEWTHDEWRNCFERVSNMKTAELWQKARERNG